jgi:hypothetical protein
MANIIKLGNPPKTFKPVEIKIELADGSEGIIPITFRYRTQDDYWAYRNEFFKAIGAQHKPSSGDDASIPVLARESRYRAAEHFLGAISAWGLDVELNADNLCALFNECQQSPAAINEAYQAACIQGRLGN